MPRVIKLKVASKSFFTAHTLITKLKHRKHVLTGRKHDMLGNQTFEVLRSLSTLSHESWKTFEFVYMFLLHKYCRKFKPGIPLFKDVRNEVIQMAAMRQISEICERYRTNRLF